MNAKDGGRFAEEILSALDMRFDNFEKVCLTGLGQAYLNCDPETYLIALDRTLSYLPLKAGPFILFG
jgi:hypothetical protein